MAPPEALTAAATLRNASPPMAHAHASYSQGAHGHHAHDAKDLRCMVLTISDSRTFETDRGGGYLVDALTTLGHTVVSRQLVADEVAAIRSLVLNAVESGECDVLICTGGTGVSVRDVTPDAVVPLFTKRLPGFGEIFRQVSYEDMGPTAILSRADAGVITRTLVFILPGSPQAVRLAMDKLMAPILPHALGLLRRHA
jgi:molybdopterin adenylyltransferase